MTYKHDMSDEPKPNIKKLLKEGWRKFTILGGVEKVSRERNEMFVLDVQDDETGYNEDWYCVSVKGKRWFLKSILRACNVEAGQDGIYEWSLDDIIGKSIAGLVEHEPNEYINRKGNTVKTTQHKIQEIKKVEDAIGWDE